MKAEELDDIVQCLVVAKYALECSDDASALAAVESALATARRLLTASGTGELTRSHPASH